MRQLSELRGHGPAFDQLYRRRCDCVIEALQVSPSGSRIDAAEDPACLLYILPRSNLLSRLNEIVEPDDTAGDEKVRQKPFGVRFSGGLSDRAKDCDDVNTLVLSTLTIPAAAMRIAVHVQPMNLATQWARLVFISEVALLQEIRYAVFDCV